MTEQGENNAAERRVGELKSRSRRKQQRRKAMIRKRILIGVIAAAAVVMVIWGIVSLVSSLGGGAGKKRTVNGVVLTERDLSEVQHLSFAMLSIGASDSRMSVEQFQEALEELYKNNYCLIDVYELAYRDENGNYSYKDKIEFPEGKIPLILSQRDVCYPFDSAQAGVADKMLVEEGVITCQRTMENMKKENGKFDLVPIVESFINKHPDFSYNGARGILGLTGYCGVLGYRTSSELAKEDNPYAAAYGTFDVEAEREAAKVVLDKLTELGWHFASVGYEADISYGSSYAIMSADAQKWQQEVEPVVGETELLIFPKQTDIGSWKAYSDGNRKFTLLTDEGFSWFFVDEKTTPYLLQIRSSYVRETIYEINTIDDFRAALALNTPAVPQENVLQSDGSPAAQENGAQSDGSTNAQENGEQSDGSPAAQDSVPAEGGTPAENGSN